MDIAARDAGTPQASAFNLQILQHFAFPVAGSGTTGADPLSPVFRVCEAMPCCPAAALSGSRFLHSFGGSRRGDRCRRWPWSVCRRSWYLHL